MLKRTLSAAALLAASLPFAASVSADECGDVTVADMNWNSATLIAHVDQFILENVFGCNVELVPGDTMATGTSMVEKGEPDIAPEMWSNSMRQAFDKGVEEKRLRYAGNSLSEGGEEGFWVPKYMVEKDPELKTIKGIKGKAAIFKHPEDSSLSAFYGCPAGWNCQINSGNLFRALELEEHGFDLVDPGSGAGMSGAIAKAYEREEAWFGYYWAPSAVLGKYEMVKVDFGSGVDVDEFINCTTKEDCESPKVTMYPPSPVNTITTERFAVKAPAAYKYLAGRSFTNQQMNELLAWMEENQADGEIAMEHFLTNYESVWSQWLPADVVAKVKQELAAL
ncbi:ABC transporter substrate-binding protein [Endozoicomonas sp. GU-1]|uniref:ABC transporter substrate-binding protein n=1 Tax=Endozoicomonas sp. GU-1 TaxID=3009078 RepID=UPI0022B39B6F|nr:ABC transporter substrate-binding protein [Endozoicomonas sp. GU-1]WBA83250.1 ABC transporter substrate-binding protein [Endozoicomonas sp. GU-1]WBA86177.1 ABC transporter substrate-binding protein [Endozoicomonas sp. GU-1]